MAMIPCPNGGKCGSRNHVVGSEAYGRCVQIATGDSYKSPFVRLTKIALVRGGSLASGMKRRISSARFSMS